MKQKRLVLKAVDGREVLGGVLNVDHLRDGDNSLDRIAGAIIEETGADIEEAYWEDRG